MATKARQQYFADEVSLSKEKREFSIADEIQQKIDGIEEGAQVNKIETIKVNGTALIPDAYKAVDIDVPEVIDNLYTIDSDNALSAKQGKLLYDYIQNIASRGRFLSNWNSATGLPMTNPSESPYPYKSGDYFIVSNVAGLGGTNYRPDGSSYIIGQASTVVETDSVDVSDFYFYDGTNWLLLKNSGRSGAVDSSLSTTSTNPVENRVITNALNGKQDVLTAGNHISITNNVISATDTTYTAGTGINIDSNNVISTTVTPGQTYTAGNGINIDQNNEISVDTTVVATQTDLASKQDTLTAGTGISIDANNEISIDTSVVAEVSDIPTVNDATLTITQNGTSAGTFTANASSNTTIALTDTTYVASDFDIKDLADSLNKRTAWDAKMDGMTILTYGTSTWADFTAARNANRIVYCKVSVTGGYRMAFLAYENTTSGQENAEFQYYRSRSSHNTDANQLDEVYIYKLDSSNSWTTTTRDTAAKIATGTGLTSSYNNSVMTIANDGVTSVNSNTGAVTVSEFTATNGGVKVFDFPSVNDDITDLITWVSNGGGALLKEGGSASNRHFRVTRIDFNTPFLTVECFAPSTNQTDAKNIFYNSSKIVTDIVDVSQNYFTPSGTATTGYVVTKTAGGYEWAAPAGGDVQISSQSNNILTSGTKLRAGTQANYDSLGSYSNDTIYLTI